ncbi:MAG: hypothetical protein IKC97_03995 [Clostridia bacterium]|nr:hypothetical protein [Clostridia bacterium]
MTSKFMRVATGMLVLFMLVSLCACTRSKPPATEEIYDTAVELIESSYAVNDIVFGYGLPVWKAESEYAKLHYMYNKTPIYENVTEYTQVTTISQIKTLMAEVYSADYLESLFVTMFDGYAYEEGAMAAQIHEDAARLYQHRSYTPLITNQRIYDYSTMRIVDGDDQTAVIQLDSHLENEQTTLIVELVLVLEDGEWKLDTPTY